MSRAMLARTHPRKLRLCRVCDEVFRPLRFGALRVYCSRPCGKRGTREAMRRWKRRSKRMAGLRKWTDERLAAYLDLIPLEIERRGGPDATAGVRVVVYRQPPALEAGAMGIQVPRPADPG